MCLAALYDMVLLSNISLLSFQVWLWACVCLRVGPASPVCAGVYEWIRLAWGKQTTRGRWQRVKCCHAQPPANQRWEYSLLNPPTAENSQWDCTVPFHQGHVQVHTGAQRFATVSGLNDMFPGNGVQRGLRYVFSCLVGVSKMSAQSAATCM